ncbi:MAG: hypothetical protein IT463_01250 [Planctomycetes bacterium]|nr:hypothetical protein [Planctomycetota bacterium]
MGNRGFWWVVGPLWACSVAGLACSIAALWFVLDLRDRTATPAPQVAQSHPDDATRERARALDASPDAADVGPGRRDAVTATETAPTEVSRDRRPQLD